MKRKYISYLISLMACLLPCACSTTANIPDDDQLFVGLTKISYERGDSGVPPAVANKNLMATQEELEAALATAPNGALFGSSYYRTPFPYGLWIWNAFSDSEGTIGRWLTKSFGKPPVLMSWVNPALRAQVAQSVLRSHGYFNGSVSYNVVEMSNPKKAKIGYHVKTGTLLTIDSISYVGFPDEADSLIRATQEESLLHQGDAFTVAALDAERTRLTTLFRNNGYYNYQPGYASYLADTLSSANPAAPTANLRLQLADGLPDEALQRYYMGHITVNMQKSFMQTLTDSIQRRSLTIRYQGKRPPVRPRVVLGNMKLRPRRPYSYDSYLQTASALNATGLFSMTDFRFTPREDTLDLTINCVFDRPYDFYVETNFTKRTIGRMGPELKVGLTRRNAFRGGEKLDVNLHGSYEWQTRGSGENMNTYEYGADASLEFPRLVIPRLKSRETTGQRRLRRRYFTTPTTLAKVSSDIVRRPGYYKMHIVSGEWTYRWQPTAASRHEFSPLTLKYQYMNSHTGTFDSIVVENPYLVATMSDYFIPQMRYTYSYTSPSSLLNPIHWEVTLSESGNVVSLGYLMAGKKWDDKNKQLFKNPYAQYVKLETDFTKKWKLSQYGQLVGHLSGGVGYTFGNSDALPFSECFYVGGANSVRAFPMRTIGPGRFLGFGGESNSFSYLLQNGDIKFEANLELRHRLFGNLHGAVFLDAGNVWLFKDLDLGNIGLNESLPDTKFHPDDFFRQLAVGTGVGLRYDLDFLILRVDWGVGLHVPYETTRSGFYNIDNFRRCQTLHFAIGYPF